MEAFFSKLLGNEEDDTIKITGTERQLVSELRNAAAKSRSPRLSTRASVLSNSADLLKSPFRDFGLNKAALVDLLGRYSKNRDPKASLDHLTAVLHRAQSEAKTPRSEVQILSQRDVRKRLGRELILELIADYRKGDTTITLMERYALSKSAVLKILRDNDVLLRRQPLTDEQAIKAKHLYLLGDPVARVAQQIEASTETTRLGLIAAGVQMRSRGRQARL